MNHRIILLLSAISMFVAAPCVKGQSYSGSVLYPLTPPNGFASVDIPTGVVGIADSPQTTFGGGTVGVAFGGADDTDDAVLWTATGSVVDLTPTDLGGVTSSGAIGVDGGQQVGNATLTGGAQHAVLWTGTAASAVDLNPTNIAITSSSAVGVGGGQQVGVGLGPETGNFDNHAMLWTGTGSSAVDLNPTTLFNGQPVFASSLAIATDGTQQVGQGAMTGGEQHALLWTSTAASAVDMNPTNLSGFTDSSGLGISGAQQVGWGRGPGTSENNHAMLWTGAANTAVDLNPTDLSGIVYSLAIDTNGAEQVGFGSATSVNQHLEPIALAWSGTAASAVDMQTLLPLTDSWVESEAISVDSQGNIYGTAYDAAQNEYAVEWSPVPEPTAGAILLIGGVGMLMRRRRRSASKF